MKNYIHDIFTVMNTWNTLTINNVITNYGVCCREIHAAAQEAVARNRHNRNNSNNAYDQEAITNDIGYPRMSTPMSSASDKSLVNNLRGSSISSTGFTADQPLDNTEATVDVNDLSMLCIQRVAHADIQSVEHVESSNGSLSLEQTRRPRQNMVKHNFNDIASTRTNHNRRSRMERKKSLSLVDLRDMSPSPLQQTITLNKQTKDASQSDRCL